ncbi:hypothetical protein AC249_AIPGENE3333 [Exaiptasia diaphana]|nr:hypothetical protein AC249_AIPGENE3333 [Exaiptasia diaphana]
MEEYSRERELKKLVFVGSKMEEIAHKINNQHDIRLGRQLRHFDREKTIFLKSFKTEQQAALEKQQKMKKRLKELGLTSTSSKRDVRHKETRSKTEKTRQMEEYSRERELKKLVFVGSKMEEIAHKINNQHDIRLGRQLRHFDREKTIFLKSFKTEQQAALEKQQKMKKRLKELGLTSTSSKRDVRHKETRSKVRFFITNSKDNNNTSQKNCLTDSRRIRSAQEFRKNLPAKKAATFYNET